MYGFVFIDLEVKVENPSDNCWRTSGQRTSRRFALKDYASLNTPVETAYTTRPEKKVLYVCVCVCVFVGVRGALSQSKIDCMEVYLFHQGKCQTK